MRKIINDPDNIVEEMMEGFIAAYHHMYYKHPEVNSVISRCRRKNKVSLIIGGGSGHEPMFSGFVGAGLADAACCGNIFASPDPKNIYETGKSIDEGKGMPKESRPHMCVYRTMWRVHQRSEEETEEALQVMSL